MNVVGNVTVLSADPLAVVHEFQGFIVGTQAMFVYVGQGTTVDNFIQASSATLVVMPATILLQVSDITPLLPFLNGLPNISNQALNQPIWAFTVTKNTHEIAAVITQAATPNPDVVDAMNALVTTLNVPGN